MTLKVKFDEQDTNLKASFDEVFIVGDGSNNTQVDQEVIEESTNAVSGGAVKKYVDEVISQISKPDDIEIDTTLSIGGAAADAKATGEAIKTVKNGALTTEYYAVETVKMAQNGLAQSAVRLNTNATSTGYYTYELTVGTTFIPVIFEDGVQYKFVDAPFEYTYVNGALWNNRHQFKRVGITSPVITEQLGITDVLWFDTTIPKIMGFFGMSDGNYKLTFGDASKYGHPEGVIVVLFTIDTSTLSIANQVKGLWDLIFANPETKLIFEYENQENIPVIDAPYSHDATPIDVGGLNNGN